MEKFFFRGIFLVLFHPCLNCFFRNSQELYEVGIVVNIFNPSSLKKTVFQLSLVFVHFCLVCWFIIIIIIYFFCVCVWKCLRIFSPFNNLLRIVFPLFSFYTSSLHSPSPLPRHVTGGLSHNELLKAQAERGRRLSTYDLSKNVTSKIPQKGSSRHALGKNSFLTYPVHQRLRVPSW